MFCFVANLEKTRNLFFFFLLVFWVEFVWSSFCRNPSAENLYGYAAAEVLGHDGIEVVVDPREIALANDIFNRVKMGESWTGKFPVKNKMGESFIAVATNTPFYDDHGSLVGVICVSSDSRPFLETRVPLSGGKNAAPDLGSNFPRSGSTSKLVLDSQQPLQVSLASKISNLVSIFLL